MIETMCGEQWSNVAMECEIGSVHAPEGGDSAITMSSGLLRRLLHSDASIIIMETAPGAPGHIDHTEIGGHRLAHS